MVEQLLRKNSWDGTVGNSSDCHFGELYGIGDVQEYIYRYLWQIPGESISAGGGGMELFS